MAKNNDLYALIRYVVVVVLLGGLAYAWLSASPPILYAERNCYLEFSEKYEADVTLSLYNKGKEIGYPTVCIASKEFVFKNNAGEYSHKFCYYDVPSPPKETELLVPLKFSIKPDSNIFDKLENASYTFEINCKQMVWGIAKKSCPNFVWTCDYIKDSQLLRKV